MAKTLGAVTILAVLALAGCGDTVAEQAIYGAGAGAGASAVLDGNIGLGALLGATTNVAYCQHYPSRC